MFGNKQVEKNSTPADQTAIIGEGSEIDGKYTFSGTLILNGRLKGEIVSNDRLMIGEPDFVDIVPGSGRKPRDSLGRAFGHLCSYR